MLLAWYVRTASCLWPLRCLLLSRSVTLWLPCRDVRCNVPKAGSRCTLIVQRTYMRYVCGEIRLCTIFVYPFLCEVSHYDWWGLLTMFVWDVSMWGVTLWLVGIIFVIVDCDVAIFDWVMGINKYPHIRNVCQFVWQFTFNVISSVPINFDTLNRVINLWSQWYKDLKQQVQPVFVTLVSEVGFHFRPHGYIGYINDLQVLRHQEFCVDLSQAFAQLLTWLYHRI